MRGANDARLNRRSKSGTSAPPPGGKVLQRLFAYLGRREPRLNDEIVASIPVPKTARQLFGLTTKARHAKAVTLARVRRARRPSTAAKSFASAVAKAAITLRKARKKKTRGGAARALAAPSAMAAAWQAIGPTHVPNGQTYGTNRVDVSGRVSCIAVDPGNPKHVLVGAAGGGIWESTDTGATWNPRTDQMPSLAIGAVTFDPTNSKRVYVGSGEGNFYANLGAGVYQSTDGGTTWAVLAASPFLGVGFFDLVVDPKDPKTLYAATTAGFFKSVNGGASWSLKRPARCWDISVHPGGGLVELLAAFADGVFVSMDGGNTFAAVALPNPPSSPWMRVAVDRVAAAPDVAYVFGAAGNSAYLWRRSGAVWTKISNLPASLSVNQAWYDWYVAAAPDNPAQVFVGAIDALRGDLAGSKWTWTNITTQGGNSIHPDQHCLTFATNSSRVLYAGSDGGIFRSPDSGATWKPLNKGLGISELEYLAGDPATWKWLMAGTQDNGTLSFTGTPKWTHIADGDGGDCGVNQLSPNIIYHSYYNVSLERSNDKGASWTALNPPNVPSLFYPPVEVFGSTVAIGATSLLVTRTGAAPWTTVALALSANEVSSAMREIDANTILVGTNFGRMLRVSWNGTAWARTQLTSPSPRYISCIAVDPSNPQRIWVTFSQVGGGSVYRSDDGGGTWINCSAGLPGIPMNAVVVDPADFHRVWVAADVGVYQTLDTGKSWASFAAGLPNAMAVDLLLHKQDRMLVCATRNRGAWAIAVP
jgi:photosystem II stability/assembly factor-like uncharacterized protein